LAIARAAGWRAEHLWEIEMCAVRMVVLVLAALLGLRPADAAEPTLVIATDAVEQRFTATELLTRSDSVRLSVPNDVSYGRAMTYRAVPLLALLGGIDGDRFDTLEARALDDFVAQLPLALAARGATGEAVAWVAVEDPADPWPPVPGRPVSAGPFALVWEHPERSGIRTEQWPYALASLTLVESPARRWPQLAVPAELPDNAAARRGQEVFLVQCLPCHRLAGGGAGDMGPDLDRPMNPTQYLTDAGLRGIIRNPRAVRTWPDQRMEGFDERALPDADLDAVVAYLHAIAGKATAK
jgi:mono/diheme cytochrome c family protein